MSEDHQENKQNKTDQEKLTIGLLMGLLNEPAWVSIWAGVADMAREQDVNLICFTGGILDDTIGFQKQANILYDLVDVDQLDGLIIWGGIGKLISPEKFEGFYQRYQSIPSISIGDTVADEPGVLVDNYGGMYQVVTHLVEDHGFRRIAYIKGHENFQEHDDRYRAYCDALNQYGLALDPTLVVTENDTGQLHLDRETGKRAVEILLDDRQAKYEAIVTNDDLFAYGVIEELQSRGIHVPHDMSVIGFNNDEESQYITPPLSTVPYPFYEIGRQSAEMLLVQLHGKNVPEQMFVPTRFMVRQSCGCLDPAVEQISASTLPTLMNEFSSAVQNSAGQKVVEILNTHREDILIEVEQLVELALTDYEASVINVDWFGDLLDTFGAELSGTPGVFLRELDAVMRQVIAVNGDVMMWQNVISGIRRQLLPYLESEEILLRRAEDLWQQARVMIGEFARRVEGHKALRKEQQSHLINEFGRKIMNMPDIPAMMDILAEDLPKLGIKCCYLSLYQDPAQSFERARLLMAYDEAGRKDIADDLIFDTRQLAPNGMFRGRQTYNLVVQPLYFREDQQGFILFEAEHLDSEIYLVLRGQISSALQGALLIQKRNQIEKELAQERDLLQSLMDTSTDVVYFKDLDSRFIRISTAHAGIFNLNSAEEAVGKWDFDFFSDEHAQQAFDDEQKIIKTDQPIIGLEEKETWPDGRVTWASTSKMPLKDVAGNIVGTFGISRDITNRRNTEYILSKRATEMEIVAQVSTAALNILDRGDLLQKVVDLTKENFGLYHAHIYLLDDITNQLVLTAGADEVGRKMVIEGWSIPFNKEQSLVARAARIQTGVIVNNVRDEAGWLPNKHLPQTRSELAVPLLVGDRVLGVLDVQSDKVDTFTDDDIRIQTTLAAQIAVALENARLFEEAERADFLLRERVKELDCLNDIGREMEENPPPLPELLTWVAQRIPPAMQYPNLATAAIEFEDAVYGDPQAIDLPAQIVHGLYIGGEILGRIYIAYTEKKDFIDEESALLGGIATRVSGFIENQRLLEQTQQRAIELEDTTTFLDSVFENMPTGLFVKEAKELKIVRWNKANEGLHGLMEKDLLGKTDHDLFDKEEADWFVTKDREVLAGGQLMDIPEEPIHTPHRGLRYLHTTKVPIVGSDGEPRYLLGISEDITERKQVREALTKRASELGCLNDIGREMEENPPPLPELLTWITERIPAAMQYPELTKVAIEFDGQVYGKQEAIELPTQIVHGLYASGEILGRVYIAYTEKHDFLDEESALLGGIATRVSGFTENQRLLTQTQQRSEELESVLTEVRQLAAIVENHPDFIGVGSMDGKAIYLNPAGLRMMGLPIEHDVTTMTAGDFFSAEDAQKLLKEGIPAAIEQGFWSSEASIIRADGRIVSVEETISINYDIEGNPSTFSITMHDITNRQIAATEQARLLAEVEASYRQYVRQEWEQYLQEQHQGEWHIEHTQFESAVASTPQLAQLQQEAIHSREIKVASQPAGNGTDNGQLESAAVVAPISLRGQVIGTLNLQDLASDRKWTSEELALVEAVSEQLALTVENLRLFDDSQRRATREQATREITDKMHAAPDVDTIVQTGLTELANILGVSRTYVKLSLSQDESSEDEMPFTMPE